MLIIVMLLWVVCGILSYGLSLAYYDAEYPPNDKEQRYRNMRDAWEPTIYGPFALFMAFKLREDKNKKYGIKFK